MAPMAISIDHTDVSPAVGTATDIQPAAINKGLVIHPITEKLGTPVSEPLRPATSTAAPTGDLEQLVKRLGKYSNPSLYVRPDHTLSLEPTDVPTPTSTQALIHVRCTGICGSDLHLWRHGRIGPLVVDRPSILGHEASGVVLAVGSAVTNVKPGDRVAIEPGVPCHSCHVCRAGKYNLCADVEFAGVCPYAGTIRRFTTHEAQYCHKIPDFMSFEQGALLEPLSVVLHAIRQCEGSIALGKPALICGAGPIGLIALAACRSSGAWPLVITDVDAARLAFVKEWMPEVQTYHVDLAKRKSPEQCAEEIRALYGCRPAKASDIKETNGGSSTSHSEDSTQDQEIGPELDHLAPSTILECTGVASSIITGAHVIARAGTLMVVGVGASHISNIPFMHLSLREINLKFINRYIDTWPAGIHALAGERVIKGLDKLITGKYKLERAVDALEKVGQRGGEGQEAEIVMKVMIVDDEEIDLGQDGETRLGI